MWPFKRKTEEIIPKNAKDSNRIVQRDLFDLNPYLLSGISLALI